MPDIPLEPVPVGHFGLVGSGWRSEFFLRLASQAPDRLTVSGVVTRSPVRGAEVEAQWGVPTYRTVPELLRSNPEFVIPAVPWPVSPETIVELVEHGATVLAETPPAPDLAGLRALWAAVGAGGRVQVAEQYLRMPAHAARWQLLREGLIGEVGSVQLSSTHLYHAVSMIRLMLDVGFAAATVRAHSFRAPLVDPISPDGWTLDGTTKPATTTLATIDFGARMGVYDFTDNQWWNPLRSRRIQIRGSLGEIVDDRVTRLVDQRSVVESVISRRRAGVDLNLEGVDLDQINFEGRVLYRNDFVGSRFSEDDLAVVELLAEMFAWVRGLGPAPYPLAQGLQDHLISLAIEESVRTGQPVTTTAEAWADSST